MTKAHAIGPHPSPTASTELVLIRRYFSSPWGSEAHRTIMHHASLARWSRFIIRSADAHETGTSEIHTVSESES
jgi:hypothetical protein